MFHERILSVAFSVTNEVTVRIRCLLHYNLKSLKMLSCISC